MSYLPSGALCSVQGVGTAGSTGGTLGTESASGKATWFSCTEIVYIEIPVNNGAGNLCHDTIHIKKNCHLHD